MARPGRLADARRQLEMQDRVAAVRIAPGKSKEPAAAHEPAVVMEERHERHAVDLYVLAHGVPRAVG